MDEDSDLRDSNSGFHTFPASAKRNPLLENSSSGSVDVSEQSESAQHPRRLTPP